VKRPNADGRRLSGTIFATAAGTIDSCTPIPNPHSAEPTTIDQKPPRNTNGAKGAEINVSGISTRSPKRSNKRPNTSEPAPLTAIAIAYTIGTQTTPSAWVFWK
jgi:hypothetical protein